MTITFGMRNVTSSDVKTVMLRKFFQMVFVGNDRKSLHIYTATVIGASKDGYSKEQFDNKENFISNLGDIPAFRMLFECSVAGNDTNDVINIDHEDITDGETKSLFNQIDNLKKVWGDKCQIIYNNQQDLIDQIKNVNINFRGDTAEMTKRRALWIKETKNRYDFFFQSLAIQGNFTSEPDLLSNLPKNDKYSKRSAYTIDVPKEAIPKGIELVNWIRTTICFKTLIDDKDFNYCLQTGDARRKSPKQEGGSNLRVLCPDFTWYFSPPIKSFIDHRNATVEIRRTLDEEESKVCNTCSFCTKNINDRFRDGVGPVPNKMTVGFDYWVKEEKIKSRQKYRFAAKDISLEPYAFDNLDEIAICLDMTDEHSRGNRQYIMGLFISFALAFGIDTTRLEIVQNYFPTNIFIGFQADVLWLLFLILFTLTMLNRPPKFNDKKDVFMSGLRRVCLFASVAWFFLVFACSRNSLLAGTYLLSKNYVQGFVRVIYVVIAIMEVAYLIYLKIRHKDRVLAGLFGEDIL